jgi:hypothetical protein
MSVIAPGASAENSVWIAPNGRFSLAFQGLGWSALPDNLAAAAGDMLIIYPKGAKADGRERACAVSQRPPHPLLGGGPAQEEANTRLDRITAEDVQRNIGQPVHNYQHGRLGDVATVDYTVSLDGLAQRTRDFVLTGNGQLAIFDITCGAPEPMTADEAAAIESMLGTLTILPPGKNNFP